MPFRMSSGLGSWKLGAFAVALALGANVSANAGFGQTLDQAEAVSRQRPGQQPARDAAATKPASGVIRGLVLGPGKSPLRRVRLVLRSPVLTQPLQTTTDLDGRFEFAGLREGRYRLAGTKGSFVAAEYGQRRANRPGTEFALSEGQTVEKVTLVLSPGAAITGTVFDDLGEPAAFVRVTALRRVFREGRPQLEPVGHAVETNDLGQYRLFGLASGSYFIGASGLAWTQGTASAPEAPTSAPTFYPGTMALADAIRINLGAGEERPGVNLPMLAVRSATVSGSALDSSGKPATSVILAALDPVGGVAATGTMGATSSASVKADGSFSISNVAPGDYMLSVYSRGTDSGDVESAAVRIGVVGEDMSGLSVVTAPGARITGRIIVAASKPSEPSRSSVQVFTEPVGDRFAGNLAAQAKIAADWSFELTGVAGQRRLRANAPSGWTLRSVTLDGTDITDSALEAPARGDLGGLQIILTDQVSSISGTVSDAEGRPQRDYWVVAFPADSARWTARSRYLQSSRPDQNGRFSLAALPAGTYLVSAIDDLDDGEGNDPEFLDTLRATASPITIADGEQKTVDLKLTVRTRGPQS
jgi:hypothetical protein